MRVEKQGYFECMLAVIAALGDKPLAEIRGAGCIKANVSHWSELAGQGKTPIYWETIRYLTRRYKVSGVPTKSMRCNAMPGNIKPLDGRGSIVIRAPSNRETHIMPFENDLIYDPGNPSKPFPLSDLENRYPNWTIRKVSKSRQKRVTKSNH